MADRVMRERAERLEEVREADVRRDPDLLQGLVALWRTSVEATHGFLTGEDIARIAAYVPGAMQEVEHLAIAEDAEGTLLGFVGVDGATVEMLFVDPGMRGNGIGGCLLRFAQNAYGANKLDVNEQNGQARGFYEHAGYEVIGRSETDGMGEPFPILHMRLKPRH